MNYSKCKRIVKRALAKEGAARRDYLKSILAPLALDVYSEDVDENDEHISESHKCFATLVKMMLDTL